MRTAVEELCAARASERITDAEISDLRALGDQMVAARAIGDIAEYL